MRVLIRSEAQHILGAKNTPTLPKIDGPLVAGPEVTQSNPFLYSRSLVQHSRSSIFLSKQDETISGITIATGRSLTCTRPCGRDRCHSPSSVYWSVCPSPSRSPSLSARPPQLTTKPQCLAPVSPSCRLSWPGTCGHHATSWSEQLE